MKDPIVGSTTYGRHDTILQTKHYSRVTVQVSRVDLSNFVSSLHRYQTKFDKSHVYP